MAKYLSVKLSQFKSFAVPLVKRRTKLSFIRRLAKNTRLLDVGCGNDSPFRIKLQRPDVFMSGLILIIKTKREMFIAGLTSISWPHPRNFPGKIESFSNTFDAVLCAHNPEHCDDPDAVLNAILKSLKKGGRLYLSFPSEKSLSLPKRAPLNFYDDPTHKAPPNFDKTINAIRAAGLEIDFAKKQYRPGALRAGVSPRTVLLSY